ncbi:MAG: hypothetical protein ACXABV_04575 [Candidatus Thorarchaeota archaeon]
MKRMERINTRMKLKALLLVVFMLSIAFVGTTPMTMVDETEGGGGGPTYIKMKYNSWSSAVLTQNPGNWQYSVSTSGRFTFRAYPKPSYVQVRFRYEFNIPSDKRWCVIRIYSDYEIKSTGAAGSCSTFQGSGQLHFITGGDDFTTRVYPYLERFKDYWGYYETEKTWNSGGYVGYFGCVYLDPGHYHFDLHALADNHLSNSYCYRPMGTQYYAFLDMDIDIRVDDEPFV